MKPLHRIACISNPDSGYNKTAGMVELDELTRKHSIVHKHIISGAELEQALNEIAERKPEILVINGGDGTVDAAITLMKLRKMFDRLPILVLLQGGTTNMIHRDVGLADSPVEAFERLIETIKTEIPRDKIQHRQPMAIYKSNELAMYGFFFAMGAVPRVMKRARERYHNHGFTGVYSEVLSLLSHIFPLLTKRVEKDPILRPSSFLLQTDIQKSPDEHEVVFACATTLKRLIWGMNPGGTNNKVKFFALPYPYKGLLGTLRKILSKTAMTHIEGKLTHISANALELSFIGEWALDGEIYYQENINDKLRIEMAQPIEFLVV